VRKKGTVKGKGKGGVSGEMRRLQHLGQWRHPLNIYDPARERVGCGWGEARGGGKHEDEKLSCSGPLAESKHGNRM
jgi:hypothetical protein